MQDLFLISVDHPIENLTLPKHWPKPISIALPSTQTGFEIQQKFFFLEQLCV